MESWRTLRLAIKAPLRAAVVLLALVATVAAEPPFLTRTWTFPDGEIAHYVVFVPPSREAGEKLPVILFLNGWGENGDDGLRQISNNFGGDVWRMRATFPFLAVCPQCAYNGSWDPGSRNETLALAVLDAAIREFNGDPDRVIATGASTGGTGALNVAQANAGRFAAVVPVSAPIHLPPEELARSRLPVWAFYNANDSPGLVRESQQSRRRQLVAGSSPLVTEFPQEGHNAWDAAYSSPALYRWMLNQTVQKRGDLFGLQAPKAILESWSKSPANRWEITLDELRGQSGPEGLSLRSPELGATSSVQFDVELGPGVAPTIVWHGPNDKRWELRLCLAEDGVLKGGTFPSGETTFGDPAAQRSLKAGWNDVRLERDSGTLAIALNGWPALQVADPFPQNPMEIEWKTPGGTPLNLRYVRVRKTSAEKESP